MRFLVAILVFLLSALSHGSITDPLFIKAELPVHVVFIGVDPGEVGDFTQYVDKSVRPAVIDWVKGDLAPLPYSFDVKIIVHLASGPMVEAVAKSLKESGVPLVSLSSDGNVRLAPMPLLYDMYVKSLSRYGVDAKSVVAVDASSLLLTMAALTEKYIPEAFWDFTVYIICGERLAGRPVAYFHRAVSPDTGIVAYDVGFNVYGGGWWSKSVMVDVCSAPPVEAYDKYNSQIVIQDTLKTAKNKAELIGLYVDLSVKFAFAKGNIYRPRYEDNVLINIYVVDISSNAISYSEVKRLFNGEMAMAAFKTLYPYAFIQTHIYLLEGEPRSEELKRRLRELIKDQGSYVVIDTDKALELIDNYDVVQRPSGVFVIPVFILVTDKTAVLSGGAVGAALPESHTQRAGEPWGVLIATAWGSVQRIGLTFVVAHEVGHVVGLFHSFNTAHENSSLMHVIAFLPVETAMTYSASWGPSLSLRDVFYGVYAFRSYYSIFDIDSVDRGVIVDLLERARENVLWVIKAGYGELLSSKIGEVEFYYNSAIEEFKKHNYFDRVNFKGLGVELSTSFDHAYMAYVKSRELVNLVKQLEGLGVGSMRDKVRVLEEENSRLRADLGKAGGEVGELRRQVAEYARRVKNAEDSANVFLFLSIALVVLLVAVSLRRR